MKALLVDDSSVARAMLGRALTSLGFEVCEATSGNEALLKLEEHTEPPDVALIDWNMPGMSGLQLVEEVRRLEGLEKLQIVMVTMETEMERVAKALEAGADEFVMKPFSAGDLVEKFKQLGLLER